MSPAIEREARSYWVVSCTLSYRSVAEASQAAPEALAAHIARSRELHAQGTLLMAGAFVGEPDGPLQTMAVLGSREAAEDYLHGDPFYVNGAMTEWRVREWANLFA